MEMQPRYRIPPRAEITPEWAYEGSPFFRYAFGGIAQGAQETINLKEQIPGAMGYAPFDELVIHNDSIRYLYLVWNGVWTAGLWKDVIVVAPTSSMVIEKEGLTTLSVYNAAPSAGQDIASMDVRICFRRKPWDVDEIARRRYFGR